MQKADSSQSAFRNLIVWQRGMELVKEVYKIARQLPKEEQFALGSQIRRAAVSVPSNIAEGAKRGKKEFVHFLRVASGSGAELETQLLLVEDLYTIDVSTALGVLTQVQKVLESLQRRI